MIPRPTELMHKFCGALLLGLEMPERFSIMNAILKAVREIFSEDVPPRGPGTPAAPARFVHETNLHPEYLEVSTHPEGHFSFWMEKKAVVAMSGEFGLSIEEIKPLAFRVFEKCRELGFWHGEPVHFVLNACETKYERGWMPCKIVPPMPLPSGKIATRSIVVALATTRPEDEDLRNTIMNWVSKVGRFKDADAKRRFINEEVQPIIKAKHKMIFTHEMVHVLATDEYRPIMGVLGLDLLELLTDAINLVTFYSDFKSADSFVKTGVCEGAGYVVNLINREVPGIKNSPQMVELAHQRARQIIQDCQTRCAVGV